MTTWLCLLAIAIGSLLSRAGVVVCSDGTGGSRVEWGCDRNERGECVTDCGPAEQHDDGEAPHPCDDRTAFPDQGGLHQSGIAKADLTPPMLAIAELPARPFAVPPGLMLRSSCPPTDPRPPDAVALLRSIIILV